MAYWLLKSEPSVYSIDDLAAEPGQTTLWDGVRNYQARNHLRAMRVGDQAFFYHSSCDEPGVVGVMQVVREAYPDPTAFDPRSKYFDAKSTADKPRWQVVDLRYARKLRRTITLAELKSDPALVEMPLVRRGNRLSVMPVPDSAWRHILALE